MTQAKAVHYWRQTAEETIEAAKDNFGSKHYDWSFFLWHLSIEKTLKGILISQSTTPPPIHHLVRLINITGIKANKEQIDQLKEINTYNIAARYDDYKRSFYQKVTHPEYARKWAAICEDLYLWLSKLY